MESWIYIFGLEFGVENDVFDIIGKNCAESIYVVNAWSWFFFSFNNIKELYSIHVLRIVAFTINQSLWHKCINHTFLSNYVSIFGVLTHLTWIFRRAVLIKIHLLSAVIIITMIIGKGVKCSYFHWLIQRHKTNINPSLHILSFIELKNMNKLFSKGRQ